MGAEVDLEEKRGFITAFFDHLDRRIDLAVKLHREGHDDDAMLLCCCHIDGLANHLYWDLDGSNQNFVRAVREHGGHHFLGMVHLKQLRQAFAKKAGKRFDQGAALFDALPRDLDRSLRSESEILALVEAEDRFLQWLEGELWRGTLAAVAYAGLRVPSVHALGASGAISFSETTIDGVTPVPAIDFDLLHDILMRVAAHARVSSEDTNRWFGHDFKESTRNTAHGAADRTTDA